MKKIKNCILILLINIPLIILELEGDNFLVNSIIVIDLIAIALSVFYLVYRLILSFGMLYVCLSNRFFIALSAVAGILAYLLYLFVSNIYGANTESVMLEYIEHYTIFNNGVFSISLVLLVIYKITYTSNQIEISKAFISAIAHEVFSPISIVKVKSELLFEKITSNDKSDLEDRVKELIKLTNIVCGVLK